MSSTGPLSELESLRLQVAELTRTLAERDQTLQDRPEQSNLLRAIVEGTSADIGVEFFRSFVKHLAQSLHVRFAFVGEWREQTPGKVSALAVWSGTDFAEPFEYDLKGSPCEHVIGKALCLHESGVQERFPDDQLLVQLEVQSYCGMPLFDQSGTALGLLVVMDDRPFTGAPLIKDLLQVFAARAAAELQRQQAEITLREQGRRLCFTQFSLDHAADAVLWADDATRFIYANEAACRSLGYSNEELLTLSISDIAPHHDPVQSHKRLDQAKQGTAVTYESVHRRKDGTEFPIEVSVIYLEQDGRGYTCGIVRDITERKHIEQERLQALCELRNVMETVPDFMFILDCQGAMVKWNRRVEEVTGYSPEELLNMSALAFVPPEAAARTTAAIHRAFTEGYAELDGYLLTKDHRLIPYYWTGALLKDSDGDPIGITGIGRDVTEKKRLEVALQQERQHLVEAQALAHLGSWRWNIESGEEVWSDEQFRIFGYEPGSISVVHETFMAAVLPDDHDRVLVAINDALIGTSPYEVECRIVRPNGDVREIQCRGDVHRDEIGHPISMTGTVLDITERKRVEESIRQNRLLLQSFIEHTPAAVAMLDRNFNYVAVSKRWYQDYRLGDRDIIGLHHYDVFPEIRKMEQWQAIHRRCLAGEIMRNDEDRLCREDGKEDWFRWEVRPWVDESGSVGGIIMFTEVITERKQAESKLRLTQFTIDHAVDAAYWINREAQIVGVNEAASLMLGYSKDELCAMTVHDLNPDFQADRWPGFWAETRQRKTLAFETFHRSKTGELIPVEVNVNYLSYEGQELHCAFVRNITDRKHGEEVLRASEERFDLAVHGSNTGIWDWDLRTGKSYFSPLWKSMLGYEAHELRGEFSEWEERLHPDDLERALATVQAYLKGDIPQYELEHRLRHKDGGYRWILARGISICDAEGKPYRVAGSHIEITEQKQTQEALAQSEHQLRTVLDALPVGVWFTDPSGKPVLANPAAKQIWSGIKQIRIENAPNTPGWWEAIGPSDGLHRWALSHALTKGVPSLNETFDFECLDGTMKTIRNTTVPVHDEAGVVLGAIVLNEDITALRQAQEALKLTQFSVDHAVEGFFWIGSDARILNVNEAACRMLEYTRDELTTMTLHDIDPTFPQELWSAHWEELKQKGSMTFESKHWSRTGRVLDTEVTVKYLQYDGREYNCAIMRDIGERKRVTASLRQSEERYRSLVDNAPIGIFVNEAGRFVYANQEMQRLLKAPSAERLIGTPVLDRIAPEFHQLAKDRMRQLMDGGQPVPLLDEQFVRLDGSRVDVAVTAIPTSFDGTPVIQVLALDITERKQAEEALRKNHSLLSVIMDTATDFIYVKDLAGRYLLANSALAQFMGKSVEEVIGQDDHVLLPPELAASCVKADQQVIATGMTVTLENYGIVGGKTLAYLTTTAPYRDRAGRIIGVIGVSHDISERKQAEEELRESHSFIRQIIDADPNFIFVKDRTGQFTLVNKAVADAYGTTVEHLLGKADANFNANQEEVEFFRQKDLEVMDSLQERFIPEEVITDSTGKTRWLQTVKRPIFDEQGQAIMVLGASTDITERKRMEEALRQRERDLRAAIEERERISQDLHDGILQSLFAVGLSLETTKLMMSPKERKTSGPALDQAIDQLNQLMHEVRNFIAGLGSDLLQGKDLPTALYHMLETLTKHHPTRVRLKIEDRAARALSAEQSLHLLLVIQEAVSNCIRHGHAQEATVSLKLLKQGIRLSVRDNGCGFNLNAAKKSGHGLVNMAARAQKIGGRLTLSSHVNEGTRVVLDLPKEAFLAHR